MYTVLLAIVEVMTWVIDNMETDIRRFDRSGYSYCVKCGGLFWYGRLVESAEMACQPKLCGISAGKTRVQAATTITFVPLRPTVTILALIF